MKVELTYPKIPDTTGCMLKKCWVFEKYDGTNMHWDHDGHEFISFGTRRDSFTYNDAGFAEFDAAHPELAGMPKNFDKRGFFEEFMMRATKASWKNMTVFTECFGPNSFAGQHKPTDMLRNVILDVSNKGKFLSPKDFLELFAPNEWKEKNGYVDAFPVAKLLYVGKYSGQLVEDIRNGKFPVTEGAIIKGIVDKEVYRAKIKTNAYMERLKTEFKDSWKDYWE